MAEQLYVGIHGTDESQPTSLKHLSAIYLHIAFFGPPGFHEHYMSSLVYGGVVLHL